MAFIQEYFKGCTADCSGLQIVRELRRGAGIEVWTKLNGSGRSSIEGGGFVSLNLFFLHSGFCSGIYIANIKYVS